MNLDTEIRGLPLKYWLVIAAGGIGIGYLVTRNPGNASTGVLPGASVTKASNELNAKVTLENMQRESVVANREAQLQNYEQYAARLQEQAQRVIDSLAGAEKAIKPVEPINPRQLRPLANTAPGSIRQSLGTRGTITSLV